MNVSVIKSVYFSPAGTTQKVTRAIANELKIVMSLPGSDVDFTTPAIRKGAVRFEKDELVVFGVPTYAGRVPNKILPVIQDMFSADAAPAIAVVTFGNRAYDSSLTELSEELSKLGFRVFAAGAFVTRHVFSELLAPGRPGAEDERAMRAFAQAAMEKLGKADDASALMYPVINDGAPVAPYYIPLDENGNPAVFLKAKPVTEPDYCDRCAICVQSCPMRAIDADCVTVSGTCIKCNACVSKCPQRAKYFDDPAMLSHIKMLEANYRRPAANETFL